MHSKPSCLVLPAVVLGSSCCRKIGIKSRYLGKNCEVKRTYEGGGASVAHQTIITDTTTTKTVVLPISLPLTLGSNALNEGALLTMAIFAIL